MQPGVWKKFWPPDRVAAISPRVLRAEMAPRMCPSQTGSTRSACLPGSALQKTCPYGGRLPAYDLDVCHCTQHAEVEVFSTEVITEVWSKKICETVHLGLHRRLQPLHWRSLGSKCHPYITFTRGCRNAKRRLAAWQNNSLPGCSLVDLMMSFTYDL